MCLGRSKHRSFQKWAAELFLQALPELEAMSSPRAWAFGLIGVQEYLEHLSGDRNVSAINDRLTGSLFACTRRKARRIGRFEPVLSYVNAKLPHALIGSGRHGGAHRRRALELGPDAALAGDRQTRDGRFVPIGSTGSIVRRPAGVSTSSRSRRRPRYRPVEAFEATHDRVWLMSPGALRMVPRPQRPRPTAVQSVVRRLL
jgi:hypothetical protein